MERGYAVVALVVLLLGAAGCTGAIGSETASMVVASEENGQGETFVYVEASGGQLPAGTEITVENTLSDVETVSGTLDRPANEGTRVYLGGPLGSDSLTEFRYGMAPATGVAPPDVTVSVTVTVDTGERVVSETIQIGG